MTQRPHGWLRSAFAVGLVGLLASSCAEEVGDIDRTSPNKLKKTQFAGSWYFLQTMIDVPQQTAQGFIGNTNFGNSAKVVFELTEDWLYVLPMQETVQFSEKPYKVKKIRNYWEPGQSHEFVELYVGEPIAAFPVESHFDVRREYSTSTGKQSNVISENATDRVWHEREYVRINWGGNAVTDWMFPLGSSQMSSVDHYVQGVEDQTLRPDGAGTNPDIAEFEGDYMSFVTKAFVAPSEANWQGYLCDPYGVSNKDCAGSVIKVRHSFKRADATPDVETFVYTNREHMDKFGFFLAERHAYDSLWDLTESKRDYKAQRWNLWQSTWDYRKYVDGVAQDKTEDVILGTDGQPLRCRDHVDCGTDDKVLDFTALRCVKDSIYEAGTCKRGTLHKLADRGLRPIIYHMSALMPDDGERQWMRQQFYKSADEWSRVYKDAVAWGLALEDKGQYWTRACETNADCTKGRSDVLVDHAFPMPQLVDGAAKAVGCSATNPCAKNQNCKNDAQYGDVCHWNESGELVVEYDQKTGTRKGTVVIYENAGKYAVALVQDGQTPPSGAAVRFVNVSGADATLTANGATLALSGKPADSGWYEEVIGQTAGDVTFAAGGKTTALKLANSGDYVVVLTADGLYAAGALRASGDGLRFYYASASTSLIEAGLNGARIVDYFGAGQLSAYAPQPFDEARVVVTALGAQGDVTCFFAGHEGRCSGWSASWSEDDNKKVAEYKATLPDMFLLCENQYDAANEQKNFDAAKSAGDTQADRGKNWELEAAALNDGRYSVAGKNPYNTGLGQNQNVPGIFNPCRDLVAGDPTALKKIGDMRYNYIYWVAENQAASPLGYGPSAGDPETGQLVWGTAYIYGAPTLTYGQASKDLADIVNGVTDPADVVTGKYIRDFVQRKGDVLPQDNSGTLFEGGLAHAEHAHEHPQFDAAGVVHPAFDPFKNEEIVRFMTDKAFQKQLLLGLPTVSDNMVSARLDAIRGTALEDMMINDEVRFAVGGSLESAPTTNALREKLSPASWASGKVARAELSQGRNKALAKAPCSFDREFMDDNIYGMAKEFFCTDDERAAGTKECLEGDDLRWKITVRIASGLIEHEIGHTMGLRHNFGGSPDLFNFHDQYYEVREKEQIYCKSDGHCDEDYGETCLLQTACSASNPCPGGLTCVTGQCVDGIGVQTGLCALDGTPVEKLAPRAKMTEQERLNKLSEYQYSTVMDYGGTFNADVHGLGKYDYAAIKFGYLKMVDIYTDTSKIRERIASLSERYGNDPSNFAYFLDTDGWRYAGVLFSPFYYLENYIGVEQNKKRRAASYEQVKLEKEMVTNYDSGELYWSYIEVPYRFCSDEFNGNLGCYTWDTGVDVGEIVHNAIGKVDEYYIIDAFKRESLFKGGDSFIRSYYSRLLTRYLNVLADSGRYFAIYDNIFRDRSWYPDFSSNIYSLGTLASAAQRSFNHLAQMIAAPAPGSFEQGSDGVYRNISYEEVAGADLTVPVGVGKFPYTQFLSPEFYGFENHVLFVGGFWSKLAALETLTDSTFYSSSDWVGEQLPTGRSTSVGFNTLYQREMTNLLGGLIAESLGEYSGLADVGTDGKPVFRTRDLFNPADGAGAPSVEPSLNNLSLKLYATWYGMANLPAGFDPSFTDAMAVFLEGHGDEYDLTTTASGVEMTEFKDPFGGKTYRAYAPNYDSGRIAPAYTIVQRAQAAREAWENASGQARLELERQMKKDIEVLDALRSFQSVYGSLTY